MATNKEIEEIVITAAKKYESVADSGDKVLTSEGEKDIDLPDGRKTPNLNKRLAGIVQAVKSVNGKTGDVVLNREDLDFPTDQQLARQIKEDRFVITQDGRTQRQLNKEFDKSINDLSTSFSGGYYKTYPTLEDANSDISNIPFGTSVKVSSSINGGDYYKSSEDAKELTKSPYDPLQQSINYSNNNPLFKPVTPSALITQDLFKYEDTGFYNFATFQILDVTINHPERTPFFLHVDKVHPNGLTITHTLITKTGNFYYAVGTKVDANSDPDFGEGYKKIVDEKSINSFGFLKAVNKSGASPIGILTPDIVTELGYTSANDIPSGTYYVTSSNTAANLGLPNSRGGLLNVGLSGTTTVTGVRYYAPLGKDGIYTGRYTGSWGSWKYIATLEEVESLLSDFVKKDPLDGSIDVFGTISNNLGLQSWTELPDGFHSITSSAVATAWGLPNSRGGRLSIDRAGTTAASITGRAEWQVNGKLGIYRNNLASGSWTGWSYIPSESEVQTMIAGSSSDSVDKSVDNAVIGIGSSSMHRYNAQMQIEMTNRKRTYINAGFGGTGFATAAMFCGQGKYFMNFDNATLKAGVKTPFTWSGGDFGTITDMPTGDDYRDWTITLENGVRGKIYFGTRTFEPVSGTPDIAVNGAVEVYPNYARYKRAINVLNTGKNSFGNGSAERIAAVKESFDETIRQLKEVQPDARFIVLAHHVNTGSNATITSAVQEVNAYLKNKYGNRFVDLNAWVTGPQIWIDLGITPTATDLAEQQAGHIPQSLTENLDKTHMNPTVARYAVINFIIPRLELLGYI